MQDIAPAFSVLTVIEVAKELRCSKAHVHNLINGRVPGTRLLPCVYLGRRRLIRRETLTAWIEGNEKRWA
jgi:excisionase family DNA binding protein